METTQYIVAIEIGSSKIVGAIAEKSLSGYVQVIHLEEERLINCVRFGCIQNVENTKGSIIKIIKKLENKIDGSITDVYVGISGRSLHSVVSEVNRNLDATRAISDDILEKIIRDAGGDPIQGYDTIDIVPRAYFVDRNQTTNPSGQFGNSINIKVNLIVAKPAIKINLARTLSMGVRVKGYLVTPLAVAEEILTDRERTLGTMLIDLGAETTTVSIYKDGTLHYIITLPLGGRNITRDIATGLNVLEETAERVKKSIIAPLDDEKSDPINIEGVNSLDANNYIKARTGEIIVNIKQQPEYANIKLTDLHNIVLIGGASQLPGFAQKLEDEMKLKVRIGSYPQSLNILDHSINRMEYIEVFALLAKAAEAIPDGQTCVVRHNYDDGPTMTSVEQDAPQAVEQEEPAERAPKKPKKPSRWEKLRIAVGSFLSEGEESDM